MIKVPAAFFAAALLFAGCHSPGGESPAGMEALYFIPEILPDLGVPSDTGSVSEDPAGGDSRASFKEAYAEALLRGIPLRGVLGSDRVHPWPEENPLGWCQNWISSEKASNSWGIPGLVLALGDYAGDDSAPVYTVSGPVLDCYGKNGPNRANGAAAYGIPLGEVFFEGGAAVQRFTGGSIIVDRQGSRFVPGGEEKNFLQSLSPEEKNREFGGRHVSPEISAALALAWASARREGKLHSDGPVIQITFSKPWLLQSPGEEIPVKGMYLKSCNQGTEVFAAVDAPGLPVRARRIRGPVLALLAGGGRLPGTENAAPLGKGFSANAFGRTLAAGFAVYGIPLSDPLPRPSGEAEGPFVEAQRFSRGWLVIKSF